MLLARRPPAFHWRTLRESGAEEAGGVEGNPGARDGGEGQRKNIQNGPTGKKGLKIRVGRECSISRRRATLYSGGIRVGGV